MTVRGLLALPSQPLRGARRCLKNVGAAEPEPRSQPRDGEWRRASGVPAPDSADTPDGADLAARASPADRAGRAVTGELAACAVPPIPCANLRGSAPVRPLACPPREPAAPAALSQPREGECTARFAAGTAGDAGDLSQFLPGVRATWRADRGAGEARSPAKFSRVVLPPARDKGAPGEPAAVVLRLAAVRAPDSRSFGTRRAGDGLP
jgi:hypothetical protein